MSGYEKVAEDRELIEGQILYAEADDDTPLALIRLDGEVYALHNECPHRAGPLAEGVMENGRLRCPWHGALIDPKTGEASAPATCRARRFKARIVEGDIEISLAEPI